MIKLLLLTILVAVTSAGVVNHGRCGGSGTFVQLRIEGCDGLICNMKAGTLYSCEGDLFPSTSAPALSLQVNAIYHGIPILILESVLPNSSVQPGTLYTIKFSIVPNDILAGEFLPINAHIFRTDTHFEQSCVTFNVTVSNINQF